MDGCATFFRTARFALVKKYEVEFNKAAKSLSDTIASEHRDAALSRMLKVCSSNGVVAATLQVIAAYHHHYQDNVALISVLEAFDVAPRGGTTPMGHHTLGGSGAMPGAIPCIAGQTSPGGASLHMCCVPQEAWAAGRAAPRQPLVLGGSWCVWPTRTSTPTQSLTTSSCGRYRRCSRYGVVFCVRVKPDAYVVCTCGMRRAF